MTQTKTTLQQQRAAFALSRIDDLKNVAEKTQSEYVSYVSSLPATIVMNGLGQALTALLAKAKGKTDEPHRLLFNHIAEWLSSRITELRVPHDTAALIRRLMEADQSVYVRAQAEAMAYLNWLKQFARAYLKEKEGRE